MYSELWLSQAVKKNSIYPRPNAIQMKNRKKKLWRRYKEPDWSMITTFIKEVKDRLRNLTRYLHTQFENILAQDTKLAPKKFFSSVKSNTKSCSKVLSLMRKDGTEAMSVSERAEALMNSLSPSSPKKI